MIFVVNTFARVVVGNLPINSIFTLRRSDQEISYGSGLNQPTRREGDSRDSGLTAELEIYRAANILLKQYGAEEARLIAAKRAKAMIEFGDVEGLRTWKAILRAVLDLRRKRRGRLNG